jgi:hypothetical protein
MTTYQTTPVGTCVVFGENKPVLPLQLLADSHMYRTSNPSTAKQTKAACEHILTDAILVSSCHC